MLSIEQIVNDPDFVRRKLIDRGETPPIEELIELDARRRVFVQEGDELRARRNEVSRGIGQTGGKPSPDQIAEMRSVGDQIKSIEGEQEGVERALNDLLMALPNLPMDSVPVGPDEGSNVIVREGPTPVDPGFDVEPNWDFADRTGIFDLAAGARMSGARFYVLKGKGAALQRALSDWMLDVHTREHGYTEIAPPFMVRSEAMTASGNLPKFADNLFRDAEEDLWLIPTAEVGLNYLHAGEILESDELPLKYVAHTPCFRRERTAAGRDTRGIKRVHQFEKVEMFQYVDPEQSDGVLEAMIDDAIDLCERLGLPWRLLALATGDISFQSAQTFDLEVWAPGSQEWLEVSSLSNCTDFQARRSNTRYRPEPGAGPRFPHTLNGSGLALPRMVIAVLENFQQPDGTVTIPEPLRSYTGFDSIP
ncbi:MAG: serine--tRNA ligase [Chloroflexi bacterium]|nr:serine--tRNA ligase [Chloroflexota bacterium]